MPVSLIDLYLGIPSTFSLLLSVCCVVCFSSGLHATCFPGAYLEAVETITRTTQTNTTVPPTAIGNCIHAFFPAPFMMNSLSATLASALVAKAAKDGVCSHCLSSLLFHHPIV